MRRRFSSSSAAIAGEISDEPNSGSVADRSCAATSAAIVAMSMANKRGALYSPSCVKSVVEEPLLPTPCRSIDSVTVANECRLARPTSCRIYWANTSKKIGRDSAK